MLDQTTDQQATEDYSDALRRTALLASLSISKWSATVSDDAALQDLKQQQQATGNVGKFMKNLLAGADAEYKALTSALEGARTLHYKLTLPWVAHEGDRKGPRLLPNVSFVRYMKEMAAQQRLVEAAKATFKQAYPVAMQTAMQNLGQMGDATKYPTADQVVEDFKVFLDISPIPAGSDFKGLPENLISVLNNNMQKRTTAMIGKAMDDVWSKVRDAVSRMVDRLVVPPGEKPKIFHNSLVSNARELVDLLDGFNIVQDPRITEVQADLRRMLDGVTPDGIRDNEGLRAQVATQAADVQSKLNEWGV